AALALVDVVDDIVGHTGKHSLDVSAIEGVVVAPDQRLGGSGGSGHCKSFREFGPIYQAAPAGTIASSCAALSRTLRSLTRFLPSPPESTGKGRIRQCQI